MLSVLVLITANTFYDANYRMPHSISEQEDPAIDLLTTDSESDAEVDAHSDVEEDDVDEEELWRKWLSTAYEHGSKKPMKERLTAPLDLPISDADVEKLKVGIKSRSMDDKWDILVEDPDENGGLSIHIIRHWVQEECYILHIVPSTSDSDGGSAKVHRITWEGNKAGLQCDAEQAKKEAVMLCRGHLRCEFEALPQYPSSAFWDSSAYKRLDAQKVAGLLRRPFGKHGGII
ncbi:hypothetical protein B0J13DRAFT_569232 [Dactylonectria estremocensis]|uniref:Uncharacterized protein n=1 Tax=Dactylonectria estremocensis TaxID=1079267 RepID=A0A9P9DI96_9HYPO|nr:hypothetical protein B0J13DRAFT_569232 [Dactylonectria estremocensis]